MTQSKPSNKTCFIITPIGPEGSDIRRRTDGVINVAIAPALQESGYSIPKVSHQIFSSNSITKEIIKSVYESDLVIADLSGNNPNVMYEVAIRHSSGKPIIHITSDISSLPFDINDHRTFTYTNDMMGVTELKESLLKAIKDIKENPENQSNPVSDSLERTSIINIPENTMEFDKIIPTLMDKMDNIQNQLVSLQKESHINKINYNNVLDTLDNYYIMNAETKDHLLMEEYIDNLNAKKSESLLKSKAAFDNTTKSIKISTLPKNKITFQK